MTSTPLRHSGTFRSTLYSLLFVELFSGVLQLYFTPLYPMLGEQFNVDVGTLSWALIVFTLSGALSTPVFARLGDVYGHRRILRIEVGLVALGCVLIAVAADFATLVAGRFLQGMFPAFLPLMFGLVRSRFDAEQTRRGIAYLSSVLLFGTLVGASLTGLLVRAADGPEWALWLPAAGTIIGFGLLWLGNEPPPARGGDTRVDWPGALLLGVGLAALMFAIDQGPDRGWLSPTIVASLLGGIVVLSGWAVVELRVSQPLADLRFLFRPRLLPVYIVGVGVYFGSVGGQVALSTYMGTPPEEAGYGLGLDAFGISMVFLPMLAVAALLAMSTARLGKAIGFGRIMTAGAALAMLGALGLVFWHNTLGPFVVFAVFSTAGLGLIEGSTRTAVVSNIRHGEVSMGQGIYEMSTVVGGALGGAALGALLSASQAAGTDVPSEAGYMAAWAVVAGFALLATIAAVGYTAMTGKDGRSVMDAEQEAEQAGTKSAPLRMQ